MHCDDYAIISDYCPHGRPQRFVVRFAALMADREVPAESSEHLHLVNLKGVCVIRTVTFQVLALKKIVTSALTFHTKISFHHILFTGNLQRSGKIAREMTHHAHSRQACPVNSSGEFRQIF
jgi:hypothetical protein